MDRIRRLGLLRLLGVTYQEGGSLMTHSESKISRHIRQMKLREEFDRSLYNPDSEYATPNDQDIAFMRWKREVKKVED